MARFDRKKTVQRRMEERGSSYRSRGSGATPTLGQIGRATTLNPTRPTNPMRTPANSRMSPRRGLSAPDPTLDRRGKGNSTKSAFSGTMPLPLGERASWNSLRSTDEDSVTTLPPPLPDIKPLPVAAPNRCCCFGGPPQVRSILIRCSF